MSIGNSMTLDEVLNGEVSISSREKLDGDIYGVFFKEGVGFRYEGTSSPPSPTPLFLQTKQAHSHRVPTSNYTKSHTPPFCMLPPLVS
jgi:hypothetical protein